MHDDVGRAPVAQRGRVLRGGGPLVDGEVQGRTHVDREHLATAGAQVRHHQVGAALQAAAVAEQADDRDAPAVVGPALPRGDPGELPQGDRVQVAVAGTLLERVAKPVGAHQDRAAQRAGQTPNQADPHLACPPGTPAGRRSPSTQAFGQTQAPAVTVIPRSAGFAGEPQRPASPDSNTWAPVSSADTNGAGTACRPGWAASVELQTRPAKTVLAGRLAGPGATSIGRLRGPLACLAGIRHVRQRMTRMSARLSKVKRNGPSLVCKSRQGKQFFFEKKNQKTFVSLLADSGDSASALARAFCWFS